jgi:hypothetical protein
MAGSLRTSREFDDGVDVGAAIILPCMGRDVGAPQ